MDDLDRLSDDELAAAYGASEAPSPRIQLGGCFATLVFMGAITVKFGFLGYCFVLALFALLSKLYENHCQRVEAKSPIAEKLFERGLGSICSVNYLRSRIPKEMARADAPYALFVLQGFALPHGGELKVYGTISNDFVCRLMVGQTAIILDGATSATVREAVVRFEQDRRSADRFPVRDGFPCDLLVAVRGHSDLAVGVCNLRDPASPLPVHALARLVVDIAAPSSDGTLLTGSCDKHGKITIGRP